ncbi:MAG: UDP-N-acetylmuramoyl-tripeptide--D-alanyl-D-alanine ligase [Ignavibacteriales bacterium]|nr:UDP-N-acetylmuramoyl-tripeptide--D-alanyl-D-alanine ligase [Ignavibacteriales bacterium]
MISLREIIAASTKPLKIVNSDENAIFNSVVIDSRKVVPGSLFIAVKGDRFDGHDFIPEALARGASGIVVKKSRTSEYSDNKVITIGVTDTVIALGFIAGEWRKHLKAKVIGITGSNGKTTTKDMLAAILKVSHNVVATTANNNNHIGVPLTILEATQETDFLVCEIGTNHPGEIKYSSLIAQPDLALITNIGDSHLEYLINRKGVRLEKEAMFTVTIDRGGIVFFNLDDPFLSRLFPKYPDAVTLSMKSPADVMGKLLTFTETGLPVIRISSGEESVKVELQLFGKKNGENALAAAALAIKSGISLADIKTGLESIKPPKGRMNRYTLDGFDLIDDTYNANPASMKSAFEAMGKDLIHDKRVVILGDMFELGAKARERHEFLAAQLKTTRVTRAFLIGTNMRHLYNILKGSKIIAHHFRTKEDLIETLSKYDFRNSLVLVKGSRGMEMETIVKFLKEKATKCSIIYLII